MSYLSYLSYMSTWECLRGKARGGFTPTPLNAQHLHSSLYSEPLVGIASVGLLYHLAASSSLRTEDSVKPDARVAPGSRTLTRMSGCFFAT